MASVLDKYRQAAKEDVAAKIQTATVEGQPYQAYEVAPTPQRRFDLRPGYDAQRVVSYAYLTDIVHAGGVMVGLSFTSPGMWVSIKGANLQELVDMLREERVVFIAEHVAEWHLPPTEDQPYIESMVLVEPGKRSQKPSRH